MNEPNLHNTLAEPITWDDPARLMRQMNHDLRTPLNVIIATSTMFVNNGYGEMNPAQQKAMARLHRNSHRMMALMDDLSGYVKAVTGELMYSPSPFEPNTTLDGWIAAIRAKFPTPEIEWQVRLNPVPTLNGDEDLTRQVISALIWNAVAFTESGTISITSEWVDNQWVVRVQDTGVGIDSASLPRIFDLFWRGQARPQMQGAVGGFGLGLPMARAVAGVMGGTVELEQTSPAGSTFVVKLPLAVAKE